jgi:hypothetical protein
LLDGFIVPWGTGACKPFFAPCREKRRHKETSTHRSGCLKRKLSQRLEKNGEALPVAEKARWFQGSAPLAATNGKREAGSGRRSGVQQGLSA